jgi:spoIIIJ-associated protein
LVNVNDYREKQKERLQGIAAQMADKTQSQKRASHMRGLSSYERKIVHEYVTEQYPELSTYSIGEGRDRHLVIDMKGNEPAESAPEQNTEE